MRKLENDCLDILIYTSKKRGKWITLGEISRERNIPQSTVRTIFEVCSKGVFSKEDKNGMIIRADIFDKIAKKYRFDYRLKKMKNAKGRVTWHICCVQSSDNIN